MSHVVNLILIIVGAIILLIFIAKIFEATNYTEAINVCRLSVMTQAATELQPTISGKRSPFDIRCEKRYVKFYNTKVELGLSPENMKPLAIDFEGREVKKFKSLTDHTVDQVIAEEMRICKYQFGDGKLEVFVNDDKLIKGTENYCFICSEIEFESDKIQQDKFGTLVDYTKKTSISDDGTTYYDYLTEESYTRNIMWVQPTYVPGRGVSFMFKVGILNDVPKGDAKYADLVLDKSRRYYIFFEKYNPPVLAKAKEENRDITVTDPTRVDQYWVAIVPVEDINDYCKLQAN